MSKRSILNWLPACLMWFSSNWCHLQNIKSSKMWWRRVRDTTASWQTPHVDKMPSIKTALLTWGFRAIFPAAWSFDQDFFCFACQEDKKSRSLCANTSRSTPGQQFTFDICREKDWQTLPTFSPDGPNRYQEWRIRWNLETQLVFILGDGEFSLGNYWKLSRQKKKTCLKVPPPKRRRFNRPASGCTIPAAARFRVPKVVEMYPSFLGEKTGVSESRSSLP